MVYQKQKVSDIYYPIRQTPSLTIVVPTPQVSWNRHRQFSGTSLPFSHKLLPQNLKILCEKKLASILPRIFLHSDMRQASNRFSTQFPPSARSRIRKLTLLCDKQSISLLQRNTMSRVLVIRRKASRVCGFRDFSRDHFLEGILADAI